MSDKSDQSDLSNKSDTSSSAPAPAPSAPPLWTRAFIILTLSHLLGASGYATMILLPRYLDHLGGSRADVGLIMAVANLAGLLTRPIVGWALDAAGRKNALIFGGLMTALSLAGVYLIEDVGGMAYSVRVLFGFGEGFLFTGYFALASDIIPEERRTEGLALFGVAGLLPLLVNPLADLLVPGHEVQVDIGPRSGRSYAPALAHTA